MINAPKEGVTKLLVRSLPREVQDIGELSELLPQQRGYMTQPRVLTQIFVHKL
jgi:hypothetical protein